MKGPLLHGLDVLVVEDDQDTGMLLTFALEGRGARCRHVLSGSAALAELRAALPDIILCDLMLPDGNGLEWLAEFRKVDGMADVPAVAVSGQTSPEARRRSLAAGFARHLNKPASLVEITETITALAGEAQRLSKLRRLGRGARGS